MNDHSSKKILFNRSTLFSLKAELIKKQEEVYEKKRLPQHKLENFKPPPPQHPEKSCSVKSTKKSFKDSLNEVDTEELEACRKSKAALEKKTELYEHLSDSVGTSQLAGQFLVDFSTKKQQEPRKSPSPPPDTAVAGSPLDDLDDDSEWTEFTDCLGRTRKCLKTDLDLFRKKDKDLCKSVNGDVGLDTEQNAEEIEKPVVEKPLLVQKTKDYLQTLRNKWEQKEQELLAKDNDIHYQDVLFDEARVHGVSYYAFSTEEAERRRQMETLQETRGETLRAQEEAAKRREERDRLVAARVAAARARQRARAGLPPEDPAEKKKDYTECLLEFLNQQKNEADTKAKETEIKQKEEKEREREKLRQAYIREWDVGKEGTGESKTGKFREMSQEEYVEQQRDKRIDEFAPPNAARKGSYEKYFDVSGNFVEPKSTQTQKQWCEVRPEVNDPLPAVIEEEIKNTRKGLYFSSVKKKSIQYKNFIPVQGNSLIVNELSDDEVETHKKVPHKRRITEHVEIPPPPTFDYYGPVTKRSKAEVPFTSDLREAFAQGEKLLEKKKGKSKLSEQYNFIA